jgi:hypothetical protein
MIFTLVLFATASAFAVDIVVVPYIWSRRSFPSLSFGKT